MDPALGQGTERAKTGTGVFPVGYCLVSQPLAPLAFMSFSRTIFSNLFKSFQICSNLSSSASAHEHFLLHRMSISALVTTFITFSADDTTQNVFFSQLTRP